MCQCIKEKRIICFNIQRGEETREGEKEGEIRYGRSKAGEGQEETKEKEERR